MSGIVALDTFDIEGSRYMREVFPDVIEQDNPLYETWPDHAIGLFVAKSRVTAEVLSRVKKLRFIVRHGAGYDNIDTEACRRLGIVLCNIPGVSVRCHILLAWWSRHI